MAYSPLMLQKLEAPFQAAYTSLLRNSSSHSVNPEIDLLLHAIPQKNIKNIVKYTLECLNISSRNKNILITLNSLVTALESVGVVIYPMRDSIREIEAYHCAEASSLFKNRSLNNSSTMQDLLMLLTNQEYLSAWQEAHLLLNDPQFCKGILPDKAKNIVQRCIMRLDLRNLVSHEAQNAWRRTPCLPSKIGSFDAKEHPLYPL